MDIKLTRKNYPFQLTLKNTNIFIYMIHVDVLVDHVGFVNIEIQVDFDAWNRNFDVEFLFDLFSILKFDLAVMIVMMPILSDINV